MTKRTKKKKKLSLLALILCLIFGFLGYLCGNGTIPLPDILSDLFPTSGPTLPAQPVEGVLTVHYIDVGQGDSFLLSCGGEYMLIDCGDSGRGDDVVAYLQQLGVTKLDYLVGSHPHADHMADMDEILEAFPVETFWTPELNSEALGKKFIQRTLATAEAQNLTPVMPELNTAYSLGDAQILVLGPTQSYSDPNDQSLVILVQFGSTRFLFTGDMEEQAEHDMLEYWNNDAMFQSDVLKVGHHGSDTSTHYRFLRAVDPDYGVISVGTGNSYGHPVDSTMKSLGAAEVLTYRTDYLGTIVATSDGTDITFSWSNTGEEPYIPD